MSLDLHIRTIPHSAQRYKTIGDWRTPAEGFEHTEIVISDLGNSDYEFCLALHELIEMYLCQKRGITPQQVTSFDKAWEASTDLDPARDCDEPGDDPLCPYNREHVFAGLIERLVLHELDRDWLEYSRIIDAKFEKEDKTRWQ